MPASSSSVHTGLSNSERWTLMGTAHDYLLTTFHLFDLDDPFIQPWKCLGKLI